MNIYEDFPDEPVTDTVTESEQKYIDRAMELRKELLDNPMVAFVVVTFTNEIERYYDEKRSS